VNGIESRMLDTPGARLHAELRGSGSPVLLLHGFTGSTRSLDEIAEGLARDFRVVSLDLVGHGRSDAPRDRDAYRMERCTAQVDAACHALGLGSLPVIGYSMGGRAALALAVAQPARVAALVVVGASAGLADAAARAARVRADEALATRIERDGLEAFVDAWMALDLFASQAERLAPSARVRARTQRLDNRPHGLANSLRGMGTGAQPPLHEKLADVQVPVTLVVGDEDTKFRAIARDLSSRLPDAEIEILAEAGHAAHLERPRAFLEVARRALQRDPRSSKSAHAPVANP
jgi:2-succinyl-6-hydroxy-2,4-cyclohexadiene-1-carboxylate synthase